MLLLLPPLYVGGAPAQPRIRVVALAAMWRDSCQQDSKPKTHPGWKLCATPQPPPIGRRLIWCHCSVVLFVTIGIRDITDVDTDTLANNTGVYLRYRLKNIPRWRPGAANANDSTINKQEIFTGNNLSKQMNGYHVLYNRALIYCKKKSTVSGTNAYLREQTESPPVTVSIYV